MSFKLAGNYTFKGEADKESRSGSAYVSNDIIQPNTCYKDAQAHVPLAYGVVKNFLSANEVQQLKKWFVERTVPEIKRTSFDGEDLNNNENYR